MPHRGSKDKDRKPPKDPNPKNPIPTPPFQESRKRRIRLGTIVSGAATLLAFVVLWPRMTVSVSSPLDAENIFSASFAISNTGLIPIERAGICMQPSYMKIPTRQNPIIIRTPNPDIHNSKDVADFCPPYWQDHRIGMDESITISPESQVIGKVQEADVLFVISYNPWFLPFQMKKKSRWVAISDGSGRVYWRSWPPDEPAPTD